MRPQKKGHERSKKEVEEEEAGQVIKQSQENVVNSLDDGWQFRVDADVRSNMETDTPQNAYIAGGYDAIKHHTVALRVGIVVQVDKLAQILGLERVLRKLGLVLVESEEDVVVPRLWPRRTTESDELLQQPGCCLGRSVKDHVSQTPAVLTIVHKNLEDSQHHGL